MPKLLLAISLLISSNVFCQDTLNLQKIDSLQKAISKSLTYSDSLRQKEDIDRMTSRSADFFVQYQKQQKEKQRKQAIMYIVLGVGGLIVLIIGLRRKVKKVK